MAFKTLIFLLAAFLLVTATRVSSDEENNNQSLGESGVDSSMNEIWKENQKVMWLEGGPDVDASMHEHSTSSKLLVPKNPPVRAPAFPKLPLKPKPWKHLPLKPPAVPASPRGTLPKAPPSPNVEASP